MGSSRSQMCSTAALREVVCRDWGGSLADEVSPAGDDNYSVVAQSVQVFVAHLGL